MWRVEDHTADVRLHVEADDWRGLLEESVAAFVGFVCAEGPPEPRLRAMRKIEVRGDDAAETWVQWWRALLRLWTVDGVLPLEAGIEDEATPEHTRAIVRCAKERDVDTAGCADVKAVTRHGAAAGRAEDGRWSGSIVLDV